MPTSIGLDRLQSLIADGAQLLPAEEVMEPGPSTVRPDTPAARLAERLAQRDLRWAIVTGPEGRLLGVARRERICSGRCA